jgi:hypothetical protein
MALDAARLALAIKGPLKAAHITLGAADNAALETFMTGMSAAIATAVIEEITNNAVVLPTGTPPMSNGGGPVGGTGTIT